MTHLIMFAIWHKDSSECLTHHRGQIYSYGSRQSLDPRSWYSCRQNQRLEESSL